MGHIETLRQAFDFCATLLQYWQGTQGTSALHVRVTLSTLGGLLQMLAFLSTFYLNLGYFPF